MEKLDEIKAKIERMKNQEDYVKLGVPLSDAYRFGGWYAALVELSSFIKELENTDNE